MEFGSWTKMETCILSTTESYITSTGIASTSENIHKLYNNVIKSVTSQEGIDLTKAFFKLQSFGYCKLLIDTNIYRNIYF